MGGKNKKYTYLFNIIHFPEISSRKRNFPDFFANFLFFLRLSACIIADLVLSFDAFFGFSTGETVPYA